MSSPSSLMSLFFSRVVRKSIARVLTVINQTQKENLRKFYKVSLGLVLGFREQSSGPPLARGAVWRAAPAGVHGTGLAQT